MAFRKLNEDYLTGITQPPVGLKDTKKRFHLSV